MSVDYWLGVATPFVVVFVGWLALLTFAWIAWWFIDPNTTFRGGWGYVHEVEFKHPDDEGWGRIQHTHYWPPGTPQWLGRWLEPLRVRHCLRKPEYRQPEEKS